jgi:hypothetical protein
MAVVPSHHEIAVFAAHRRASVGRRRVGEAHAPRLPPSRRREQRHRFALFACGRFIAVNRGMKTKAKGGLLLRLIADVDGH